MYFSKKYYPELFFLISTEEIRGSGLSAPVNIHSDLRIFNALIQAPSDIRITCLREQALERPDPVCDRTIDSVFKLLGSFRFPITNWELFEEIVKKFLKKILLPSFKRSISSESKKSAHHIPH